MMTVTVWIRNSAQTKDSQSSLHINITSIALLTPGFPGYVHTHLTKTCVGRTQASLFLKKGFNYVIKVESGGYRLLFYSWPPKIVHITLFYTKNRLKTHPPFVRHWGIVPPWLRSIHLPFHYVPRQRSQKCYTADPWITWELGVPTPMESRIHI